MSLGARRRRAFRTVTLPAIGPVRRAAAVLVFLFCATSFGIIVVLGNGALNTLETEIYRQTVDLLDLQTAAVLSVVQIALVTAALAGAATLRRRTERTLRLRGAARPRPSVAPRRRRSGGNRPADGGAAGDATGDAAAPVAAHADGWGLDNYAALATTGPRGAFVVTGWQALGNSLRIAALAALLAVVHRHAAVGGAGPSAAGPRGPGG